MRQIQMFKAPCVDWDKINALSKGGMCDMAYQLGISQGTESKTTIKEIIKSCFNSIEYVGEEFDYSGVCNWLELTLLGVSFQVYEIGLCGDVMISVCKNEKEAEDPPCFIIHKYELNYQFNNQSRALVIRKALEFIDSNFYQIFESI